jgi:predicted metal-binding membrane protein
MSVAWMLVVAALIAIEKLLPWSPLSTGATAAASTLLGLAVVLVPDKVPWLTIPMSI